MLFAYSTLQNPDFWMGMVLGVIGTIIIGGVMLNNLAKSGVRSDEEKEKERNTYWWNEGKKPDFDKDYDD